MQATDGGSWQAAQRLMDASLRALREAYLSHAGWNLLVTCVFVLFAVGACPIWAALTEILMPSGLVAPMDPPPDVDRARALFVGLVLATLVVLDVLTTLHRAVTILIAREPPEKTSMRLALRGAARHVVPLLALALLLALLDALSFGLAVGTGALASAAGFGNLVFAAVLVAPWLATRPLLGVATAAIVVRGEGTLRAIATSYRLLHGRRVAALLARVLLLVVSLGGAALFVGVPFFAIIGMASRDARMDGVAIGLLLYACVLPWLAMHLASIDALLEAQLFELATERIDARGLARTFE